MHNPKLITISHWSQIYMSLQPYKCVRLYELKIAIILLEQTPKVSSIDYISMYNRTSFSLHQSQLKPIMIINPDITK